MNTFDEYDPTAERRDEWVVESTVADLEHTAPTETGLGKGDFVNAFEFDLTANQRDMWIAESLAPEGDPQYNVAVWLRMEGDFDLDVLRGCFERMLARNDNYALRFDERDGRPFQWVHPAPPSLDVIDFSGEADPVLACVEWRRADSRQPFVLRRSGMYRAALLLESPSIVYLYLNAHHLVTDGVTHELTYLPMWLDYQHAVTSGDPLELTAPTYRAAVEADAEFRAGAEHAAAVEFFGSALTGVTPALFDRKAAQQEGATTPSGQHSFTVPGDLTVKMQEIGGTPFAFIAAALATCLSRIHSAPDIVLGVPFANRGSELARTTPGLFTTDAPFPVTVHDNASLRDLAVEARATTKAMRAHARLSTGDMLRALPDKATRQPFDVTLVYSRIAPLSATIDGIQLDIGNLMQLHHREALSIQVVAVGAAGDLSFKLDYAPDIFDENLPIEAFAGYLQNLIRNGVERPDVPVSELSMLTAAQSADLLLAGHGTTVEPTGAHTVHGLFEQQVAQIPGRTAIEGAEAAITFADLDSRAGRVARVLRSCGVRPDDRVAVMLPRSAQMLAAVLGVLKSGAAYVPIDPGYPAERIQFMLEDSGAEILLTANEFRAPSTAGSVRVLHIDELPDEPAGEPAVAATDRNLAYVIYTSGSTGKPKGVMVEHRSVVNRLGWMQRRYPIGADDVVLQKTPTSFDVSVWELFWWAIEGARVALLPPGGEKDPAVLLRMIAERRVSVLHFVPSMMGPFLDMLEATPHLLADANTVRMVFCSGEALPPARVAQFNRIFGNRERPPQLVNLYGPTEATVDVSYYDCPGDPGCRVDSVPIGRPIDNISLYVLDAHHRPQPVGVPGELFIGGVGVARGYLNRPELTGERFIADPFAPGGRLYRTGDRARWLADGNLEFIGRLDAQVKIRGNRVELGEVENALADIPGVRDAVVVSDSSDARGVHLLGYYVGDDAQTPERIRDALANRLPQYMIPAQLVRIDEIPLTVNGKADRRALLSGTTVDTSGTEHVDPRNATEATLARVWAEVLEIDRIGIHDDYYLAGGDSILMLRIRSLAEQAGIQFSLADLTQHPTIAELAARATTGLPTSERLRPFELVSAADRARIDDAVDAYPLSRMQLGLLYYSRAQESSAMYHDVFRYSLAMAWDDNQFRHAFGLLVDRHPVLRSSIDLTGFSEPLQLVHPTAPAGLEIVDLRACGDQDAEARIGEHIEERRVFSYQFDHGPLYLLRAYVCASSVELVLSFHHAILDGASVANLVSELLQDYAHGLGIAVQPVADRALPSAAEHVRAEQRALENIETQQFWRTRLDGAALVQPTTFAPHEAPGAGQLFVRQIDVADELAAAVRQFARERKATIKSVLLAAHCATLGLSAGTTDVTTGLITHGRPEVAESEHVAGLFLNTVPVRVNTAAPSWLELVRDAFRTEQQAQPHRRYPLSAIQQDLGGAVLDTAFNYVNFRQLAAVLQLPGIELIDYRTWEETNFTLLVNASADPATGPIRLRMDYRGGVFTEAQADLYTHQFLAILRHIVQHPDQAPDFAFLAEPSMPPASATVPVDVVTAFDAQVRAASDATAITFGDRHWTYGELGRAADRVAHLLLSQGAQPGDRIGIAMERSPETIATIVGVLKAGAVTVPLDTSYPPQRIAAMLAQARPFRVIAHAAQTQVLPTEPAQLLIAEQIFAPSVELDVRPLPEIAPDSIAYLLFTSGSTGQPKGVAMPHRALANLIAWQNSIPSGAVGGTTAQYAPLSFDVSFQEIFSTLCGGGTLALIAEPDRHDMPALLRLLDSEGVQRIILPYVALQQLAEAAAALDIYPRRLRILASSGEKLLVTEAIRRLCARLPGAILENQYGPTESHVVTSFTMTGDPAAFPALPPIGTAIDGARVQVLDAQMRPVPAGSPGEIYLGGSCLADGYLDQPELTRERFVSHPSGRAGERLYRTGDLGFVRPDGAVVCTGRADAQVKIRGFRVELAEIDLAITRFGIDHPGIVEAAVVVRRREGNDAFLAAFLVGAPDHVDLDHLGKYLRAELPEYMVPSHFEWLPALPLTPSGKRDNTALEQRPLAMVLPSSELPRNDDERALAEMVANLLQLPRIGIHDNIFDLGATSLTAMRLVVQVEQRFGRNIAVSEFLTAPTVAALAQRLRAGADEPVFDPLVPIRTPQPMFFVHPLGGNILCYGPLAKRLRRGVSFYGLQAAGINDDTEPLTTVPELASYYLESIRRVQPHGPYMIGGWSFGGLVAFEMAKQLRQAGEQIDNLVILDTVVLDPNRRADFDIDNPDDATQEILLRYFFWELLLQQRGGDSQPELLAAELASQDDKFEFMAEYAVREGALPAGTTKAVIRRLFNTYAANAHAIITYRPEAIDVDLTLVRATESLPESLELLHHLGGSKYDDPVNGWSELTTGRLSVLPVPGNHLTIVEEPHVALIATLLDDLNGE